MRVSRSVRKQSKTGPSVLRCWSTGMAAILVCVLCGVESSQMYRERSCRGCTYLLAIVHGIVILLTASRSSKHLFQTSRFFDLKAGTSLPYSLALRLRVAKSQMLMGRNVLPSFGCFKQLQQPAASHRTVSRVRPLYRQSFPGSSPYHICLVLPTVVTPFKTLKSYGYPLDTNQS